jgi:iron complex transport system ATP-binding protein
VTDDLTIDDLVAGYGSRTILSGVTLRPVAPGALVALVGANAAGKSTLLRTIAGLLPPRAGRICLRGENLERLAAVERRRRVAYLPQALPAASTLYAWEAVMAACRASRPGLKQSDAERMLESVFGRLRLRELALRRLAELSGGQRQMVGLAQVVVREAGLMLLDEPTSALDPRWQIEVLGVVRDLARRNGTIAMLAMHDLNLALRFCDRVVVLAGGRLIADGAPHEVMNAAVLHEAYGIEGRVERCSQGGTIVLADRATRNEEE